MTDLPQLLLASSNRSKVAELRQLLAQEKLEVSLHDLTEFELADPLEDGTSFAQNALKKARAATAASGLVSIADDSGLVVDVMGGAPGIFSARWSGQHGQDRANLQLLLNQLRDIPAAARTARFVCAAALVTPAGDERVEQASMEGSLTYEPRGSAGFGYDPIFMPADLQGEEAGLTCAQISEQTKNSISHRGRALRALLPHIKNVLIR